MKNSLYEYGIAIEESQIHVKSDSKEAIYECIKDVRQHREELLRHIQKHPDFPYALKPVEITKHAPRIVERMAESSRMAHVGPMASVAGALADLGLESMLRCGATVAVIENGGEIAAFTETPISVAVVSESLNVSGKIGFYITQEDCPVGIATSSSKTGHAISFGEADSVTVAADDASLADAAATAICNSVVGRDIEVSVQRGLRRSREIRGVRGALIVREDLAGLAGRLPMIIKVKE